jgi:hypothetical protein
MPIEDRPFQRKGAQSNTHVGRSFEVDTQAFFAHKGLNLKPRVTVAIGINGRKPHAFDLGDENRKVLVECKAHTWTEGGNVPSAKITAWNQAMFYFYATPSGYRKILFVLRDFSSERGETLAAYYVRTNAHLIPADVEVWEFDEQQGTAEKIN